MKIKVYVDYQNCSILTEEQYKEEIAERAKIYKANDENFEDWLNDRYTSYEIFKMKSHELDKVVERWGGICEADAEEDMGREWTEYELEV